MKINLPGVHGGISQQSPHLRLQNQHSDASNVVFDVLDGIRARWGTKYVGAPANTLADAIGDIETTDGKHWLVGWSGTRFTMMDLDNPALDYFVAPSGSYMPTGTGAHKRVRTLPILDTVIVTNVDKPVATVAGAAIFGEAAAFVYIPQVFEGLAYNISVRAKTTKAGPGVPVGTSLLNASAGGTVGSGDTPEDIIDEVVGLISEFAPTYLSTTKIGVDMVRIELTAEGKALEPTIDVYSTSAFDVRTYGAKLVTKQNSTDTTTYVTTTKSYENLPPYGMLNNIIEVTEGYYVKLTNGSYIETVAPGLGYKLDKTTMPHELRYDPALLPSNPWTFGPVNDYDTWSRLVGDKTSAPLPDFVGRTINNVFFYRNRLGILSDNYVALSATGKYYNWFPETSQEVTDSDPIVVFPTSIRFSELLWAVPFGKQLILMSGTKQYILHSGYESLTPQTIAVDEATNYKLLPQVEPLLLEASIILALDHGDYAGILEYRVDDQQIATEGSLLSNVVPQFVPSDITDMVYLPAEHMILIYKRGDPTIYVYKYNKREDGQLTQMAWTKWVLAAEGTSVLVRLNGTEVIGVNSLGSVVFKLDTADSKNTITMDYQRTLDVDDGDMLPAWATSAVVTTTGKELEVVLPGGYIVTNSTTPVNVTVGIPINWSTTLSPLVLRDDNGLPRADVDTTIENMTVDWEGGAFSLTISGQGLPSRTKEIIPETITMSSVTPGTSLTEVTPTRFLVMAPAKRVTLTLSGSAYFPTRINNISYSLYVTKDRG
jgi:hypothetical protein